MRHMTRANMSAVPTGMLLKQYAPGMHVQTLNNACVHLLLSESQPKMHPVVLIVAYII